MTWVTDVTRPLNLTPPLSPVLLAGFVLQPVPPMMFQPVLDVAMSIVNRRHSGILSRMSGDCQTTYLIDPIDLPYVFILTMQPGGPKLVASKSGQAGQVDAVIRGPLACLLAMLEGQIDGDALFFSRDLVIEGDTGAVVSLRNAIDDAEISLRDDLLSLFGPFRAPATTIIDLAKRLGQLAAQDLETVRQAIIAPSMHRHDTQQAKLDELAGRDNLRTSKSKRARKPKP